MPWYEDAGCRNPCGMEPIGCASCQEIGEGGDVSFGFDDYDEREDLEENDDYDEREDLETPLGDELGGE